MHTVLTIARRADWSGFVTRNGGEYRLYVREGDKDGSYVVVVLDEQQIEQLARTLEKSLHS